MAKELKDHERAHSGKTGAKVRHGADAIGKVPQKLWNVQAGDSEIHADHVYESPKDAVKVARRYMSKVSQSDEADYTQNLKPGKNARVLVRGSGADEKYAAITPVTVRKKNFSRPE